MRKNRHAVAFGRSGGIKSVIARRKQPGGLTEWGRQAVAKRWGITLKAVAENSGAERNLFRAWMKEFYRDFARRRSSSQIAAAPPPTGYSEYDAYLGAVAERLARTHGWSVPSWVFKRSRYLSKPYFGNAPSGMRPFLIAISSFEFRTRNIFVDATEIDAAIEKAAYV